MLPSPRFGRHMLDHWPLDPGVTYLNHGTVGVTPRRVLAAQQALRDEMERQPSRFMLREVSALIGEPGGPTRLRAAAADVAAFVGARPDDLVFVDNATTAINAVFRSLTFNRDDEIVLTDHAYGSTRLIGEFVTRDRGARVRTVALPEPVFSREALITNIVDALGPRTRVLLIDHITSESGLILPVREIASACRERGVLVMVDGAHAPGQIPLDVPALGVDWYAANLHKWAHAPRSSGFLWAAPDRQQRLHPPVISWGLDQGFTSEFDWVGTRDPTAWLASPAGLAFLRDLGVEAIHEHNHGLAWRAAIELTRLWGTRLGFAEPDIACMATLPLPSGLGSAPDDARHLRDALLDEDGIEVQIHARDGCLWARVSVQVYNEWSDIERFGEAITRRAAPARP